MKDQTNKNPFEKIEPNEEVPKHLKDQVMGSVRLIDLMGGFTELFTDKMGRTASNLVIKSINSPEEKKNVTDQQKSSHTKKHNEDE